MIGQTKTLHSAWHACLVMVFAVVATMVPDFAFAADTAMGSTLCNAVHMMNGNTGKGLATIAVVVVGVGALLGKVSYGMAIMVATGVGVIFGAGTIVNAFASVGGGC